MNADEARPKYRWRVLLIGFGLLMSAFGFDTVLERKDVQFFKLETISGTDGLSLKLSGLAFHSALAVGDITTQVESNILSVLVHLVPARAGLSGSFTYELRVPPTVDEVHFGREKVVIWKRVDNPSR